jgi:hypothetical protein
MIELVFTIVILGIAVMSLPLILTQVQNNDALTLRQEAILAAKTKIGEILTYEWDENSYDATAGRTFVLSTNSPDTELDINATTFRRIGHINADYRRKGSAVGATASAIGTDVGDGGNFDDIDDFNATTVPLSVSADGAGSLDYIFNLNLTTTVNYAADSAAYANPILNGFVLNPDNNVTRTNIKAISVTVTDGVNANGIVLRAFSCNIGDNVLLPSRPYR